MAAKPIEMPFGMLSQVNPRKNLIDGDADAPTGRDTFRIESGPLKSTGF